jgi:oligopeptide transport system substrate-binding protein
MKKTILLILTVMLLAAAFIISCKGKSAPAEAMELVIMNGANPQSLDPSQITGVPEHRIYLALFEGLVGYDPRTTEPVPGVAESWAYSSDNTVITFKLRQGAIWSDGTPITAQTIVDSWLHHLDPATASEYAYMIGDVVKGAEDFMNGEGRAEDVAIRALDDRTFEVTMVGPVPYALAMMGHYSFSPLPMHAIQKFGVNWTRPENFVGNGPFILQEYIPNSRIVVVPNEKYWNRANVFLTRITFDPTDDNNTIYQAFLSGEADWSTAIPLARIDEVKLHKDYQTGPQVGTYYFLINCQDHAPLRDPRVRKALSMGFDREEMINNIVKGGQIPAYSISPPMPGYEPATGNRFNVNEARRLLAEAGYPDGRGLPAFQIVYNTSEAHRIVCEYLQQAWKNNLGINTNLVNMEWASYLDYRDAPSMQIARAGWLSDYQDPVSFLGLLVTNNGNNDGKYSNAEYDRLMRQAGLLPAGAERNALMRQAEDIAITGEQAVIPVYFYVNQNLIDLDVWEGWYANPMDTHPYVGMKRK